MPGDSLTSTIEGKAFVQLGTSELTGSCRYVGTPDFAGAWRLDEETGEGAGFPVVEYLSCKVGEVSSPCLIGL